MTAAPADLYRHACGARVGERFQRPYRDAGSFGAAAGWSAPWESHRDGRDQTLTSGSEWLEALHPRLVLVGLFSAEGPPRPPSARRGNLFCRDGRPRGWTGGSRVNMGCLLSSGPLCPLEPGWLGFVPPGLGTTDGVPGGRLGRVRENAFSLGVREGSTDLEGSVGGSSRHNYQTVQATGTSLPLVVVDGPPCVSP